jgi:hypothetical protein
MNGRESLNMPNKIQMMLTGGGAIILRRITMKVGAGHLWQLATGKSNDTKKEEEHVQAF